MKSTLLEKKIVWEQASEKTDVAFVSPYQKTDKIVLLIHGFMSNKNSETNQILSQRLSEKGIATIRFDLFGHGESSGQFKHLTLSRCLHQVGSAMQWIQNNGYLNVSIVGSSFGGLIAIHAAEQYPHLRSVALKCPVSNYPKIWQNRFSDEGMSRWKKEGTIAFVTEDGKATLDYSYYEDLLKYDTYSSASRITAPTLIVHGDADDDVPVEQTIRLFDTLRLPNNQKQCVIVPGADHAFSKPEDFQAMIDHVHCWLTTGNISRKEVGRS